MLLHSAGHERTGQVAHDAQSCLTLMSCVLLPIEKRRGWSAPLLLSFLSTRCIPIRRPPMLYLPFLHRLQTTAPLTEDHARRILRAANCTMSYRCGAVLAVDDSDQHYYVCRQAQIATMTVQQFAEAVKLALSFRLRKPGSREDRFEGDPPYSSSRKAISPYELATKPLHVPPALVADPLHLRGESL